MAALKAEAREKAKTPAQKARYKARFEKLAAKREELKTKANAAKTGRVDARKAMIAARKEHKAGRKTAREQAKTERATAKRGPSVPYVSRQLVRPPDGPVRSKLVSRLSPSDMRADYRERQAAVREQTKEARGQASAAIAKAKSDGTPEAKAAAVAAVAAAKERASAVAGAPGSAMDDSEFNDHRDRYISSLSEEQKRAAMKYASPVGFIDINTNLRRGQISDPETVRHLDDALAKSEAPRTMQVFRGVSGNDALAYYSKLKPGDTYEDLGYVSTSSKEGFVGKVQLVIEVPKGAKAAAIPSDLQHEREILLPRGSRFRVSRVQPKGAGIQMHVELL